MLYNAEFYCDCICGKLLSLMFDSVQFVHQCCLLSDRVKDFHTRWSTMCCCDVNLLGNSKAGRHLFGINLFTSVALRIKTKAITYQVTFTNLDYSNIFWLFLDDITNIFYCNTSSYDLTSNHNFTIKRYPGLLCLSIVWPRRYIDRHSPASLFPGDPWDCFRRYCSGDPVND